MNTYLKEIEIDGVKQWATFVNINDLREWGKNEELRIIGPEGYRRVQSQIEELGVYKPLVIDTEGNVLGGNSRLKALREAGSTEVWVSVVSAPDDSKKFKYNISDNDSPGFYNTEGIANNIDQFEIQQENYSIQIEEPIILGDLTRFDSPPTELGDKGEDLKQEKLLVCPECGREGTKKDFST